MKDYELIKHQANLTEVAAHFGYQMIRRESSKNCIMMKCGGHKIAVTVDADDKHWVYYTIGNPNKIDSGSVIDFVKYRKHCDFQDAVRWLKQYEHIPEPQRPRVTLTLKS